MKNKKIGKAATMPTPKRARRGSRAGALFNILLTVAFVFLTGLFIAHRVADPQAPIQTTITRMFSPIPSPETVFRKDRIAILLMGIDYNYTNADQEFSTGGRTDTIMALSLDFPSKSVHVLSVPRDMRYAFADGHVDKINSAFTMGGPHASERVIADFLGLPKFDRYVVLRINATKDLIDAIGGITVPVTETLNYDDNWGHLHIHFKPGVTHMNGEQAVSYSRFRHDACSDPCRIKRQQQVLRITIAKLKEDKFNDLAHINKLIDVVNRNVQTDLTATEKLSLAAAYSGFNIKNLKSDQVPFVDDQVVANGGDVLVPDEAAKAALVKRLFLAVVPSPSATADPAAVAAIDPATVRLQVENGSGVKGLGRTVADRLAAQKYVVDGVQNAASFDHDVSEIHVGAANTIVAVRLMRDLGLPAAEILADLPETADGAAPAAVRLVVGRDAVAAPTAAPAAAASDATPATDLTPADGGASTAP